MKVEHLKFVNETMKVFSEEFIEDFHHFSFYQNIEPTRLVARKVDEVTMLIEDSENLLCLCYLRDVELAKELVEQFKNTAILFI